MNKCKGFSQTGGTMVKMKDDDDDER